MMNAPNEDYLHLFNCGRWQVSSIDFFRRRLERHGAASRRSMARQDTSPQLTIFDESMARVARLCFVFFSRCCRLPKEAAIATKTERCSRKSATGHFPSESSAKTRETFDLEKSERNATDLSGRFAQCTLTNNRIWLLGLTGPLDDTDTKSPIIKQRAPRSIRKSRPKKIHDSIATAPGLSRTAGDTERRGSSMKFFFFFLILASYWGSRVIVCGTFLLDVFMLHAVRRMKQLARSSCVSMP
jgi:hypothetical protein